MDSIKLDSFKAQELNPFISNAKRSGKPLSSFGDFLKNSINEVNSMQKKANEAVESLSTGKEKDIHNTMIALKKAEVSFELVVQIQNKLMTAYDELKRMQI